MPNEILRYIELTQEATYAPGTLYAAANAKSVWADPRSIAMDLPGESDVVVESAFGRAPKNKFAGFYNPAGDFVTNANVRYLAYVLKWVLGGYAFTAGTPVTNPNIHESWGSDLRILDSVQGRFGKDEMEHVFQGMIFDVLSIEVEDELAVVTVEASAAKDVKGTLQSATAVLAALPAEVEVPFHQVTVTFNGVVQAKKVKNLTASIANNVDAEMGRYLGSRFPGRIPANERESTIAAEVDFSGTAEIERIWGGATGPAATGSSTFPVEMTFAGGKNASNVDLSSLLKFPKFFWQTVETQPEGREEIAQALEGRALTTTVTLNDGTTPKSTDVYTKTLSMGPIVEAATA